MKKLSIEKKILMVIIAIAAIFTFGLVRDMIVYTIATSQIEEGNYAEAQLRLEKLDGFRDAEALSEYCSIMSEYDSNDFKSVYHSYHQLNEIEDELSNTALSEEFIRTSTEVEALYNNYNVLLYVS